MVKIREKRGLAKEGVSQVHGICDSGADTLHR
jgi:hypothetical protein